MVQTVKGSPTISIRLFVGSWGFFCSAPQDFGMSGVFCARQVANPPWTASWNAGAALALPIAALARRPFARAFASISS
jgi:hypothetical protein